MNKNEYTQYDWRNDVIVKMNGTSILIPGYYTLQAPEYQRALKMAKEEDLKKDTELEEIENQKIKWDLFIDKCRKKYE